MTDKEFADIVSEWSVLLDHQIKDISPGIAMAACIETTCNIAIRSNKEIMIISKFREVANLMEQLL